jgi:hypothetical protein
LFGVWLSFFFLHHLDAAGPAFPGTNPAPFAIIQIGQVKPVAVLINGRIGAKYPTNATFNAFVRVDYGFLGFPITRFVFPSVSRFGNDTTQRDLFPGILFNWLCHSFSPQLIYSKNSGTFSKKISFPIPILSPPSFRTPKKRKGDIDWP